MISTRYLAFLVTGVRPPRRARRTWSPKKPARNFRYRAWIRSLPSCICGIEGSVIEAAHTGSDGGIAMKASDYTCVPLTWAEHREYHQIGREAMEAKYGVSFRAIVKELNGLWFRYAREVK